MNRWMTGTAAALVLLAGAGCAGQGGAGASASLSGEAGAGEAAITAEGLLRDIRELASDRFQGRAVATPGEDSTVAYLARRFQEMGLAPGMPDGSYLQRVPLIGTSSRVEATANVNDAVHALRQLEDIVAWSQRPDSLVEVEDAPIVFVGYGVVAPELGWDDFKGVDVRGKTVVMLIGDPPVPDPRDTTRLDPGVFRGPAMTYYGRWTYKFDVGAERGAAAVLLVHQTGPAGYPWSVVQGNVRERFEVEGGPRHAPVEGWIQLETARALFAAGGQDFAALERAAHTREFRPVAIGGTAGFRVRNAVRRVQSRNVVARIDGSDPAVRGEAVLFTSHWDSFGIGRPIDGDSIYNGALDDASGVAWMLALAGAYRSMNPVPRRTLVFVAFTAEEQGLLGARWYAAHPVVPLDRTLADINMDAMNPWGRTRSIVSLGYGQSSLEDLLVRHAARQGRTVVPDPGAGEGLLLPRRPPGAGARRRPGALLPLSRHGLREPRPGLRRARPRRVHPRRLPQAHGRGEAGLGHDRDRGRHAPALRRGAGGGERERVAHLEARLRVPLPPRDAGQTVGERVNG